MGLCFTLTQVTSLLPNFNWQKDSQIFFPLYLRAIADKVTRNKMEMEEGPSVSDTGIGISRLMFLSLLSPTPLDGPLKSRSLISKRVAYLNTLEDVDLRLLLLQLPISKLGFAAVLISWVEHVRIMH